MDSVEHSKLRRDLHELVRKHRIAEKCNRHEHEVVKHIMESITSYQHRHVKPKNWWNDINNNNNVPSPVFEKGYPSYEAVNKDQPIQERYHEYILRKTKEENAKDE